MHAASRGTYGAPRVHADTTDHPTAEGEVVLRRGARGLQAVVG